MKSTVAITSVPESRRASSGDEGFAAVRSTWRLGLRASPMLYLLKFGNGPQARICLRQDLAGSERPDRGLPVDMNDAAEVIARENCS